MKPIHCQDVLFGQPSVSLLACVPPRSTVVCLSFCPTSLCFQTQQPQHSLFGLSMPEISKCKINERRPVDLLGVK